MPAASAMTFLREPPSSIPSTSGLVYTRNTSFIKRSCTISAVFCVLAPATTVVGSSCPTSSACEGPHITATSAQGISLSTTSDMVIRVFSSIPFATQTIICPSFTNGAIFTAVLLVNTEGTASTSISLFLIVSSISVVKVMLSGSFTPGSLSICSCFSLSISISFSTIDHISTECPLFASTRDNAVPQLPAPIIPTLLIFYASYFI